MDDSSLDEFLDAGSDPTDGSTDGADVSQSTGERTDDSEPAAVTATWTETGAYCDDCGAETQRLWTDGDSSVCRSCKEW